MDGGGYPAGLIGQEIPAGLANRGDLFHLRHDDRARGLSLPDDAPGCDGASCGKIAGRQLDAELVESFIAMLQRDGPAFAQDADFETELAFELRVRKIAQPSHS